MCSSRTHEHSLSCVTLTTAPLPCFPSCPNSTRQRRYFYNLQTGMSTWNHPVTSRLVPGDFDSFLLCAKCSLPRTAPTVLLHLFLLPVNLSTYVLSHCAIHPFTFPSRPSRVVSSSPFLASPFDLKLFLRIYSCKTTLPSYSSPSPSLSFLPTFPFPPCSYCFALIMPPDPSKLKSERGVCVCP